MDEGSEFPIAIIGAGFAGIGAAVRLAKAGIHSFTIFERAGDIGGTWRDNTYPGAACDVPSHVYSFSFALHPTWSRGFSPQREIHPYPPRIARDYDLLRHVQLNAEVLTATWVPERQHWALTTTIGDLTADVLITGTG